MDTCMCPKGTLRVTLHVLSRTIEDEDAQNGGFQPACSGIAQRVARTHSTWSLLTQDCNVFAPRGWMLGFQTRSKLVQKAIECVHGSEIWPALGVGAALHGHTFQQGGPEGLAPSCYPSWRSPGCLLKNTLINCATTIKAEVGNGAAKALGVETTTCDDLSPNKLPVHRFPKFENELWEVATNSCQFFCSGGMLHAFRLFRDTNVHGFTVRPRCSQKIDIL